MIREELPGTAIIALSADVAVNEAMDLPVGGWYTGYRLKTRVTDLTEITETAGPITAGCPGGGPVPAQEPVKARRRRDPPGVLSPREHQVLALMAEGTSNTASPAGSSSPRAPAAKSTPIRDQRSGHLATGESMRILILRCALSRRSDLDDLC